MTSPSPLPPSRKLVPTSQPINTLPTDVARLYTIIHPLLLLSLYYFTFSSLVSDPVLTLQNALLPLSVLQLAYVVTCLPTSGSSPAIPPVPSKVAKSGQRKRPNPAKQNVGPGGKVVPALLSLLLTLLLASPLFTVILILFGAPFTTHFFHNLLCATHMVLLAVLPLFYVYGVDAKIWREITSASLPFDEVWGGTVGTLVGAWLGAIPIPLDWYVQLFAFVVFARRGLSGT
ncbi:Glycosylphosphatidylinositol (GPI) anchor assembly protein [Pseudocyphellaria aurata]|nr:Glycosylphosphatidylinositol (GPI) anchor assembly protein [Pseudocyphellaria aurata]